MTNALKRLCRSRELKLGHFLIEFATPGIGHILKGAGCDFAFIDMEHSGFSFETVKSAVRYCEAAQLPAIVRVPSKSYHHIARAADIGAEAVMVPMVDTDAEARELVSHLKYTPLGARGVALGIAHDNFRGAGPVHERLAAANERTCLFALIETASGVEHVDAIAAVEGVDGLWIGHFDLSSSLGIPGEFDASEIRRCRRADRRRGAPARQGARAPRARRRERHRPCGARLRLRVLVGRRVGAAGGGARRARRHPGRRPAGRRPSQAGEGLSHGEVPRRAERRFPEKRRHAGLSDGRPRAARRGRRRGRLRAFGRPRHARRRPRGLRRPHPARLALRRAQHPGRRPARRRRPVRRRLRHRRRRGLHQGRHSARHHAGRGAPAGRRDGPDPHAGAGKPALRQGPHHPDGAAGLGDAQRLHGARPHRPHAWAPRRRQHRGRGAPARRAPRHALHRARPLYRPGKGAGARRRSRRPR